uniref:Uncharacterized protein n=2 Tax=Meloidogyne TaxID=189290 RepID=A0A915MYQ2_MELJA
MAESIKLQELSSEEMLSSIPCGTKMANCCGQIMKVMDSVKKITLLCACSNGAIFTVTGFKKSLNSCFGQICTLGAVVSFSMLRAQRFDVSRFDGKTYFSTPFDFELIVQPNSKYYLVERVAKSVDSFTEMKIGEFYKVKCVLTTVFMPYDKTKVCAIVADLKGHRGDLYVSGEALAEKLGKGKEYNQVVLFKCFVNINDECLELHASVQDISINTDFVLCPFDKPLKTPVKRKSEEVETIEVDIKSQKK